MTLTLYPRSNARWKERSSPRAASASGPSPLARAMTAARSPVTPLSLSVLTTRSSSVSVVGKVLAVFSRFVEALTEALGSVVLRSVV